MTITVKVTQNDVRRVVQDLMDRDIDVHRDSFLDAVGASLIAFLRSYTGEYRPGIGGGPARPAHPGHWADITHDLEKSYGYSVSNGVLTLWNTSEHAVYLENRDGYFVLRGIEGSEAFMYAVRLGLRMVWRTAQAKENHHARPAAPPRKATALQPLATSLKRPRATTKRATTKRATTKRAGTRPRRRNR